MLGFVFFLVCAHSYINVLEVLSPLLLHIEIILF